MIKQLFVWLLQYCPITYIIWASWDRSFVQPGFNYQVIEFLVLSCSGHVACQIRAKCWPTATLLQCSWARGKRIHKKIVHSITHLSLRWISDTLWHLESAQSCHHCTLALTQCKSLTCDMMQNKLTGAMSAPNLQLPSFTLCMNEDHFPRNCN